VALAAAAYRGETEIVEFLVQGGADINRQLPVGKYGSALAAAVYFGKKDCVETLIESGAEVNLKLENGPFGSALRASQTDVSQEDSIWTMIVRNVGGRKLK
jgi:ankyrin repeat domain-containing protein 50